VRDVIDKFPLLGDIPILGSLFRSRAFQKSETELIIIATPHLVKPIDATKQSLPTDYYQEPNDTEFYILGLMEGKAKGNASTIKGELDGDFGHATPKIN
jgi:pilus assembly protein CpaC